MFNPNTCRYLNKSLQYCQVVNKNEKKSAYNERVLHIDHGTFTPLVFSFMEVWAESATGFAPDDHIYYPGNVIYQSQ